MGYVVMAYVVMGYVVMGYAVMACGRCWQRSCKANHGLTSVSSLAKGHNKGSKKSKAAANQTDTSDNENSEEDLQELKSMLRSHGVAHGVNHLACLCMPGPITRITDGGHVSTCPHDHFSQSILHT